MSAGSPQGSEKKRSRIGGAVNLVLVLLAFSLLGLVLWQNRTQIQEVFARPLDLRLLALGVAIFQISLIITYFRWYLLVRVIEPTFRLRSTMVLGFIGYVFNLVIPGAVGGDFIKAAYLVRMHIKKTQAVASMLIDRIMGLLGLFVLAAIAGAIAWNQATPPVQKLIIAAWVATAAGFLVLTLIFTEAITRLFPGLLKKSEHHRASGILNELRAMSATYRGRPDILLASILLSALGHSLNVFAFYLMGKMLFPQEMTTTLGQHFFMVPLTLFTMVVPLPFGALGLSEGAGKQLGNLVGHPNGALAMLGFRVLMYACGLISACVYLANLREVRSLTAEAHQLEDELEHGGLTDNETVPETSVS